MSEIIGEWTLLTASFNTTMKQTTETFQWPNCHSKKKNSFLHMEIWKFFSREVKWWIFSGSG